MQKYLSAYWVGILALLAAVIIPVYLYIDSQQEKRLDITILSNTQLVEVHGDEDRIKVFYDDLQVASLTVLTVEVRNTGDLPISSTDYETPIVFTFDKDTTVLQPLRVVNAPKNEDVEISIQDQIVEISPVLLNKNEHIVLEFLLVGYRGEIDPGVRIIGLDEYNFNSSQSVEELDGYSAYFYLLYYLLLLGFVIYSHLKWRVTQAGWKERLEKLERSLKDSPPP